MHLRRFRSGYRAALLFVSFSLLSLSALAQRGVPVAPPGAQTVLDVDPVIQQLVQSVDSNRINATLMRLEAFRTRHSATDSLVAAKSWIVAQFQGLGYTDIALHAFTWSGRTLHNIVVTKQGRRAPTKFLLLTGHYDSISETASTLAPGVNDNGTSIAIILEVARLLATKDLDLSIKFILFSAEEQGLLGSEAYVSTVAVPQNLDIKLVLNIDEVGGYRGNVNTMVKVERDIDSPSGNNQASAAYTDTLAALTQTYSSLTTTITQAYGSDYMPFQDAGFVITGFYEGIETPVYHHSTDNYANVDPPYVCQVAKASLAGAAYFGEIRRKFLSVRHTPVQDLQDTSHAIQIDAEASASAQVTSARVVYRTNWSPTRIESTLVQRSVHGDTVVLRGWIPKQPYGTTVSYFLRIATLDTLVATFPADTLQPLQFHIVPDSIAPSIVHDPLPNQSYLDAPFGIRVQLADANGIGDAWVEYRVNGGADSSVQLTQYSANEWRGTMVRAFAAGDFVEYRVQARDASFGHNLSSLPASGRYSFRILNSVLYDFESSNAGFSATGDWQWGVIGTSDIPAPPHGVRVWGTNLAGNYSNYLVSTLVTPTVDLTGKTNLVLAFKHFYSIEPLNDGGNISVSIDSGAYQLLTPAGGYPYSSIAALGGPGYSGNSFTWQDGRVAIQQLREHRVRFRFLFASDFLTTQRGWYVDDVRIDFLDTVETDIPEPGNTLPKETRLSQNFPNPFNPATTIRFALAAAGHVSIQMFDLLGREVRILANEFRQPGEYAISFDAGTLPSGIYFYRMTAGSFVQTRKLILLR
jgi:acetylornithine deacetylase/succinyl-diaminopimelate desuccinylase-like protein